MIYLQKLSGGETKHTHFLDLGKNRLKSESFIRFLFKLENYLSWRGKTLRKRWSEEIEIIIVIIYDVRLVWENAAQIWKPWLSKQELNTLIIFMPCLRLSKPFITLDNNS